LYKVAFEDPHHNIKTRNELIKGLAVALTGKNAHRKIWINLGGTACGKSTLLNLLNTAYQGYFITLKAQNFVLQKNVDANEHCGWLSDLRYPRIAMTSECPSNIRLDGNLLKTISGGDPVQSRKMYANPEAHGIQATVFMMANALSVIEPMDEAMKDRVSAIPWNVQFKKMENRDETVGNYVQTTDAHDALFFILQDAYKLYLQEGFCQVEEIDEFTKTFTDEQDQFKQLFEEKFEVGGANDVMLTDHVYRIFKSISNSQSHVAQKLLNDYGVKKEQRRNAEQWVGQKMAFVGIKLKDDGGFIVDY
jgi:phage/plasmid-associated DNA primase